MRIPLAGGLALLLSSFLPGQGEVILDLDSRHTTGPRPENRVVQIGPWLYFAGSSPATGVELFRVQVGSAAAPQLVRDIRPGPASSSPFRLWSIGATLFFFADDGQTGFELWRSDGTPAGTALVRDIRAGSAGSARPDMIGRADAQVTSLGATLIFVADDATNGAELWRSDGTAAGTVMLRDINPGAAGNAMFEFATLAGVLYFAAQDTNGNELWRSDGTAAGTFMVKDIGTPSGNPFNIAAHAGALWFQADDGSTGYELWTSDGTTAGTVRVKDIRPGVASSYPHQFVGVGPIVMFTADDGTSGRELWRTDGTAAGTFLVRDINPGSGSGTLAYGALGVLGSTLLLVADDGASGRELWRSDGTAANTVRVADIHSGASSAFSPVRPHGASSATHVFFAADDGTAGVELWRSDGTPIGTMLLADLTAGASSSVPRGLQTLRGGAGVAFIADQSAVPSLFESFGTVASTRRLASPVASAGVPTAASAPVGFSQLAGRLVFTAGDAAGYEPWSSDGTPAGSMRLRDLRPGVKPGVWNGDPTAAYTSEMPVAVAWDNAYFVGWDNDLDPSLWRTDGTPQGTAKVVDLTHTTYGWRFEGVGVGERVYFLGRDTAGFGLFVTSGSAATTARIRSGLWPTNFASVGNTVFFFNATSRFDVASLWYASGTTVAQAANILASRAGIHYARLDRALYVFAAGSGVGVLAHLAPTGVMTTVVNVPMASVRRGLIASSKGALYFPADSPTSSLMCSDGTTAGTRVVRSGLPGPIGELTPFGGGVVFTVQAGQPELWRSDGTSAGTVRIHAATGRQPRLHSLCAAGSRRVFFVAPDDPDYATLWSTDGSAGGTRPVLSRPWRYPTIDAPTLANAGVFFRADDWVVGRELGFLPLVGIAHASGAGCAASGYVPVLSAEDPVLGGTTTIELSAAIPNASALFLAGAPRAPQRLWGGCSLHVQAGAMAPLLLRTDARGRAAVTVSVPNLPSLIGARVAVQAGVGPASTGPLGLDLSNAVLLVAGR